MMPSTLFTFYVRDFIPSDEKTVSALRSLHTHPSGVEEDDNKKVN